MTSKRKACLDCRISSFPENFKYCPICGNELSSFPQIHNAVYNKLKEFRLACAQEEHNPAFTIFKNDTLLELSTYLPKTEEELKMIKGLAEKRIEKYGQDILRIISENRDKEPFERQELSERATARPKSKYAPVNIYTELKAKYPDHMIFIQCGYFYEVFGEDAKECHRLFSWETIERCGLDWTGVPHNAYKFKGELQRINKPYLIVEQVIEDGDLKREVTEEYPSN